MDDRRNSWIIIEAGYRGWELEVEHLNLGCQSDFLSFPGAKSPFECIKKPSE